METQFDITSIDNLIVVRAAFKSTFGVHKDIMLLCNSLLTLMQSFLAPLPWSVPKNQYLLQNGLLRIHTFTPGHYASVILDIIDWHGVLRLNKPVATLNNNKWNLNKDSKTYLGCHCKCYVIWVALFVKSEIHKCIQWNVAWIMVIICDQ